MQRIALLTVYTDNYKPLADIVIPNMQKYCDKHNYALYTYNITGTDIYFGFRKVELLIELLKENKADVVLCLDLDTLITNHNIKVESFLDSKNDFYITKDVNGINAGSFIVKNSSWSINFLNAVFNGVAHFNCEQDAINFQMQQSSNRIKILNHPSINSLLYDEYAPTWGIIDNTDESLEKPTNEEGDWEKSNFILHLPGIPLDRRVEIFKSLENEIIL